MLRTQFVRYASTGAKRLTTLRLYGVDGTYATALFNVAVEASKINQVSESLARLKNALAQDKKLGEFFNNPALSARDRQVVVDTVAQSAGLGLDTDVVRFLGVLAENNRLNMFVKIQENFEKLNDNYNGIVNATVMSVEPLDPKSLRRIEKALANSKYVGKGKTLRLVNEIKPVIQGGLIVEIEDKTVDLSIASRIQKLNSALQEPI